VLRKKKARIGTTRPSLVADRNVVEFPNRAGEDGRRRFDSVVCTMTPPALDCPCRKLWRDRRRGKIPGEEPGPNQITLFKGQRESRDLGTLAVGVRVALSGCNEAWDKSIPALGRRQVRKQRVQPQEAKGRRRIGVLVRMGAATKAHRDHCIS